jgi:hypothetical protein
MPRKSEDRLNQQLDRLCGEPNKICHPEIIPSDRTPGKFQLSIDGVPIMGEFDSEHEIMLFMTGFVMGASEKFHELLEQAKNSPHPLRRREVVFNNPTSDK